VPFVSAHDTISEEAPSQAWSGKRRMCSPGLACDPSSIRTRASTARLTAAVQGLQGPGSRPVPLRVAHDPDRPTADLRPTLRCETTLTWHCELRAAASTWLRRARAFACLACSGYRSLGYGLLLVFPAYGDRGYGCVLVFPAYGDRGYGLVTVVTGYYWLPCGSQNKKERRLRLTVTTLETRSPMVATLPKKDRA
jgi:hypothetical protein